MTQQRKQRVGESTTSPQRTGSISLADLFRFKQEDHPQIQPVAVLPPQPQVPELASFIKISADQSGRPVVSARELYEWLGFNVTRWAKWAKKNIVDNPFGLQGTDWEVFNPGLKTTGGGVLDPGSNGEESFELSANGRRPSVNNPKPTTNYALSLDFAERLSQLARTEQGERVRRWFQARRDELLSLKQSGPVVNPDLRQLVADQREQLDMLQATLRRLLQQVPTLPFLPPPAQQPDRLRQLTIHQINIFSIRANLPLREAYTYFYRLFSERFGVNVFALTKSAAGSFLDAIDRHGYMPALAELVDEELTRIGY